MLIKLKPFGFDMMKNGLIDSDYKYVDKLLSDLSSEMEVHETESCWRLSGKAKELYQLLYSLSRIFDIELM